MDIKKNDIVKIIIGKDKGKEGKVLDIDAKKGKVLVEGLNVYKKHKRPKKQGEKGEIINLPRSMEASNVMIKCPNCGKPTRISHKVTGKVKSRHCKKCKGPF